MKTTNLFLILFFFFISCKEATKSPTDCQKDNQIKETTTTKNVPQNNSDIITEITQDPISETNEERNCEKLLDFDKFASEQFSFTKKAKLDFSSNEGAKYFKTRIIEAYKSDRTDFASYYINVIFGCGANCIMG